MIPGPFTAQIAFRIGPIPVSETVVTTWGLMSVLVGGSWLATRRLSQHPGRLQMSLELLVNGIVDQIESIIHAPPRPLLPLIGTLFIFLLAANLSSALPGIHPPTARLETAASLALIVFFSAQWLGLRRLGLRAYLRHYVKPSPLLLPLNLLSELTRTLSLTIRLFGNIMSHELIIAVLLSLAGLLVPVPIMALGLLIGAVQAYIFAVLSTVFIGAALGAVEAH